VPAQEPGVHAFVCAILAEMTGTLGALPAMGTMTNVEETPTGLMSVPNDSTSPLTAGACKVFNRIFPLGMEPQIIPGRPSDVVVNFFSTAISSGMLNVWYDVR